MSGQESKCDLRKIDSFLSGQLSLDRQAVLEDHLEVCEDCRNRLHQDSADHDVWEKATEYLRPDDHDSIDWSATGLQQRNPDLQIQQILEWLGPTDDPRMLGRVDCYEIMAVIGSGGMGVVLKGLDQGLNRVVAIKVLAPHLATSSTARIRFSREAQAAAAITHNNVIDIYSVSEFNGLPFLVMPYARGPSLQRRIDQRGPLPIVEVLRIGHQIASGLAAAHEQGLVHRDVKPSNILFVDDVDRLLITDFGLARTVDDASVTHTGVIAGTPQYMSPEQARGESVDARSDLFALGSVIYTLASGRVPFAAETNFGLLRKITDQDPQPITKVNPEVPDWLNSIVEKLHAKDPQYRMQTAEEAATVFKSYLAHIQNPSSEKLPTFGRSTAGSRLQSPTIRRTLAGLATLLLIGFVVLAAATLADRIASNTQPTKAGSQIQSDSDYVVRKRMKAIVFAIHSYADAHDQRFPPAVVPNPDIDAADRLSGFVLLLPYFEVKPSYLDQAIWEKVRIDPQRARSLKELFDSIDLTAGWNDKANEQAARTAIEVFQMPGIRPLETNSGFPVSHVALVRGYGGNTDGVFPGDETIKLFDADKKVSQISDGTTNTLAIGQISKELGPWIAAGHSTARFIRHTGESEEEQPPNFGGVDHDAAFFVFCDGSMSFIDLLGSQPEGLKALATRSANDNLNFENQVEFYDSAAQFRLHTRSDR